MLCEGKMLSDSTLPPPYLYPSASPPPQIFSPASHLVGRTNAWVVAASMAAAVARTHMKEDLLISLSLCT